MKRLVAFSVGKDRAILVEVDEPDQPGQERVSRSDDTPDKARVTFEKALSNIGPTIEQVITKLREGNIGLEEITVEFGFKLSAQAGAVIASASAEANYKVTVTWKNQK